MPDCPNQGPGYAHGVRGAASAKPGPYFSLRVVVLTVGFEPSELTLKEMTPRRTSLVVFVAKSSESLL